MPSRLSESLATSLSILADLIFVPGSVQSRAAAGIQADVVERFAAVHLGHAIGAFAFAAYVTMAVTSQTAPEQLATCDDCGVC